MMISTGKMSGFIRVAAASCSRVALMIGLLWSATFATAVLAQDVAVNEVLYIPGTGGSRFEAHEHEWVEIFNLGPGSVDLTGWTISNRLGGADITLPSWVLPGGSYLTVHLESGADDNDFDDLDGHYYTGSPTELFDDDEDECALYSGVPGPGTIIDFVSWSNKGSYAPDVAHNSAVAAGIWAFGDFVDTGTLEPADTLARYFDGHDRNLSDDWRILEWSVYAHRLAFHPENPIQLSPKNRSIADDSAPTFVWSDFADADSYELQVDDDVDFSSPAIDLTGLSDPQYDSSPLPNGVYFYRVRAVVDGTPTHWAAEWMVVVDPSIPTTGRSSGAAACSHVYQHKDTKLLCIWEDQWKKISGAWTLSRERRGGCVENGAHAWDVPHPNAAPPGCPHCNQYCARASIAMLNAKYGGDLSQDRISYEIFKGLRDEPEGDLGHHCGVLPTGGAQVLSAQQALSWALNGAAIAVDNTPTFAEIKGWVDTRGCFMVYLPAHFVVIDDYLESSGGGFNIQIVYTEDPWNGPHYRYVYEWVNPVTADPVWGRRHTRAKFTIAFIQPAAGVTARPQEAAVTTDSDGDGVMDFDEKNPRTFHSSSTDVDTDDDQVNDKNDIRNYTFHDMHHAGHDNDALTFSDFDDDDLRSENDCDSDGKDGVNGNGDFDGGEDINGDGHNPDAGETCMFDPNDWLLTVHVDKDEYVVGEEVYIVDVHGSRETHTYHCNTMCSGGIYHGELCLTDADCPGGVCMLWPYWYELGAGCPVKADKDPLAHHGSFVTDAGGHALKELVHRCPSPGQHYLYVDVLDDFLYATPDNTDPRACWTCVLPPPDPHGTPSHEDDFSFIDFGMGGSNPPIPADFFGPGSDPFVGSVGLQGDPIDPDASDASTFVQRSGIPVLPDDLVGTVGTVDLEIVQLRLVSAAPITVTFNGGQFPEQWDVGVGLSDFSAPVGSLTAGKTHDNGGTFDTTLHVQPKLTFTKVSDPGEVRVLDTGLEGIAPIDFSSTAAPFVHSVDPSLGVIAPSDGTFVPFVEETMPGDPSSQQVVPTILDDPGTPAQHMVVPATLAAQECGNDIREGTEQCDGTDDEMCPGTCQTDCTCFPGTKIPTISEWGLVVMALLILTAGTIVFTRQSASAPG